MVTVSVWAIIGYDRPPNNIKAYVLLCDNLSESVYQSRRWL